MTVSSPPVSANDDVTRRMNARLGLLLGGIVLLTIVGFMVLFTYKGLPKDPKIVARMKQEESAQARSAGSGQSHSTGSGQAADAAPVGDSGQAANVHAGSTTGPTSQPSQDQQ
jgi:hypothetical protein